MPFKLLDDHYEWKVICTYSLLTVLQDTEFVWVLRESGPRKKNPCSLPYADVTEPVILPGYATWDQALVHRSDPQPTPREHAERKRGKGRLGLNRHLGE